MSEVDSKETLRVATRGIWPAKTERNTFIFFLMQNAQRFLEGVPFNQPSLKPGGYDWFLRERERLLEALSQRHTHTYIYIYMHIHVYYPPVIQHSY